MNRRDFLKLTGKLTALAAALPFVRLPEVEEPHQSAPTLDYDAMRQAWDHRSRLYYYQLLMGEDARTGDLVTFDDGINLFRLFRPGDHPLGVAARDIKAGEAVIYSPQRNTSDIIIHGLVELKNDYNQYIINLGDFSP